MRPHPTLVALTAATLALLVGCSSPEGAAPTTSSPAEPSASPTATVAPQPSATPTSAEASDLCSTYEPAPTAQADGGAIEAEIAAVTLPEGVVLNPGVQTITSVDSPGSFETVVRVCSDALTEEALIEVGNAVAVPLAQTPVGETLSVLVVSGWSPDGETLQQDETITTDFQLYTWDPGAAVPLSSNWD